MCLLMCFYMVMCLQECGYVDGYMPPEARLCDFINVVMCLQECAYVLCVLMCLHVMMGLHGCAFMDVPSWMCLHIVVKLFETITW